MEKIRFLVDHIRYFLSSPYFDGRYKVKVHFTQIALVLVLIGLVGGRLATISGRNVSRGDTIGIVMGIKTLVVITYQLATSHAERFRKWRSLKAYAVLNSLEVLFWFTVVIVTLMGVSKQCEGISCGLLWMNVLLAVLLNTLAIWAALVTVHQYRYFKSMGTEPSEVLK